jgi:hypothetical protein
MTTASAGEPAPAVRALSVELLTAHLRRPPSKEKQEKTRDIFLRSISAAPAAPKRGVKRPREKAKENLHSLPEDLLLKVLGFLAEFQISGVSRVSRLWLALSNELLHKREELIYPFHRGLHPPISFFLGERRPALRKLVVNGLADLEAFNEPRSCETIKIVELRDQWMRELSTILFNGRPIRTGFHETSIFLSRLPGLESLTLINSATSFGDIILLFGLDTLTTLNLWWDYSNENDEMKHYTIYLHQSVPDVPEVLLPLTFYHPNHVVDSHLHEMARSLPSLTSLSIGYGVPNTGVTEWGFAALSKLPSLTALSLDGFSAVSADLFLDCQGVKPDLFAPVEGIDERRFFPALQGLRLSRFTRGVSEAGLLHLVQLASTLCKLELEIEPAAAHHRTMAKRVHERAAPKALDPFRCMSLEVLTRRIVPPVMFPIL